MLPISHFNAIIQNSSLVLKTFTTNLNAKILAIALFIFSTIAAVLTTGYLISRKQAKIPNPKHVGKDPIKNSPNNKQINNPAPQNPPQKEPVTNPKQNPPPTNVIPLVPPSANPPPKIPTPQIYEDIQAITEKVTKTEFLSSNSTTFSSLFKKLNTTAEVLPLLDEVLREIERKAEEIHSPYLLIKYGYGKGIKHRYANVKNDDDEHPLQSKYDSIAAIRNMIKYGAQILDDFKEKQFLGNIDNYDHGKGLKLFQKYTGTLVDLDTELELNNDSEAVAKAKELIIEFGKLYGLQDSWSSKLTAEDVARKFPKRKLHFFKIGRNGDIDGVQDVGGEHHIRSECAVWKRKIKGKQYYYINVPIFDNVILSVIKLPYMIAEVTYYAKKSNGGQIPQDFIDDLIDTGISDGCFNDKLRQFSEFYFRIKQKYTGESVQENAHRRLESEDFGLELKQKGIRTAMAEALDQNKLTDLVDLAYANKDFHEKFIDANLQKAIKQNNLTDSAYQNFLNEKKELLRNTKNRKGALQKALDKCLLTHLVDPAWATNIDVNGRSKKDWNVQEKNKILFILKDKLNNTLFQDQKDYNYSLFDERAVEIFMDKYYTANNY